MMPKTDKVYKLKNNNLTILLQPFAYFQIMYKIPAKFHKDASKTVGELASQ